MPRSSAEMDEVLRAAVPTGIPVAGKGSLRTHGVGRVVIVTAFGAAAVILLLIFVGAVPR